MSNEACNCLICANEFDVSELKNITLSNINVTRFKICNACFNLCDPAEDYKAVKEVIEYYSKFSEAKNLFNEASDLIEEVKR